jgi:hypothetical protein
MTDQPVTAHPTHDEYVVERALSSDRWVVESIVPAATQAEAEADAAWFMDPNPEDTFRTVRRTITSTVVANRPGRWDKDGSPCDHCARREQARQRLAALDSPSTTP